MIVPLWNTRDERPFLSIGGVIELIVAVYMAVVGGISIEAVPLIVALIFGGILVFLGILTMVMRRSQYGGKILLVCILSFIYSLSVISFGVMILVGFRIEFKTFVEAFIYVILFVVGGLLSISVFAFLSYVALGMHLFDRKSVRHGLIPVVLAILMPLTFAIGLSAVFVVIVFSVPIVEVVLIPR